MMLKPWVKLPTAWIERRGLTAFRWKQAEGSAGIAGLMVLMALAHRAEDPTGRTRLTYDDLATATGLSRTKISHGLGVLVKFGVVARIPEERSTYQLVDYNPGRSWGMLPARFLYGNETITAFQDFHLRRITELDALKAYFAFVARRDNETNMARMTYVTIENYTGIHRNRIRSAISFLAALGLVHVEHLPSQAHEYGFANAYRLAHLYPRRHMGTSGRALLQ